jgi:hypothetical protein
MVTKEAFIKRILVIIEKILREGLLEEGTLEEMYNSLRIIFQRRLYFTLRRD